MQILLDLSLGNTCFIVNIFAQNIRIKEIIKPNSKLPLSPKNNFGSLKRAKLKDIKMNMGINIVIKNNLIFSSDVRKYKIANMDIDVKLNVPSAPSK